MSILLLLHILLSFLSNYPHLPCSSDSLETEIFYTMSKDLGLFLHQNIFSIIKTL